MIGFMNRSLSIHDITEERTIVLSSVTVAEIYALSGMSRDEERRLDEAFSFLKVIPIDRAIAKRAGILARIRRRATPDLLIAATALEYDIPLYTKNVKDFKGIPGLLLV